MNAERVADMLNALMLKLGYDKYVVQGGQWQEPCLLLAQARHIHVS